VIFILSPKVFLSFFKTYL